MDSDDVSPHQDHTGGCSVVECIPAAVFPSTRDQLLVALVRHHARSSLLWELSRLPEGRTFGSAAEVDATLNASHRVATPLEPW